MISYLHLFAFIPRLQSWAFPLTDRKSCDWRGKQPELNYGNGFGYNCPKCHSTSVVVEIAPEVLDDILKNMRGIKKLVIESKEYTDALINRRNALSSKVLELTSDIARLRRFAIHNCNGIKISGKLEGCTCGLNEIIDTCDKHEWTKDPILNGAV